MYLPPAFRLEDVDEIAALVADVGAADLITVDAAGWPLATRLPIRWDLSRAEPGAGRWGVVRAHFARANPHWATIQEGGSALLLVGGPQAYVSPGWYPSKREDGRVVPTWNYTAVHLRGTATVHHEPNWLLELVTGLTADHEKSRPEPWSVSDAPAAYVAGQLRAIVGIEIEVTEVLAKAKLSQNRSDADYEGVRQGLAAAARAEDRLVAHRMPPRPDAGSAHR